MCLWTAILPFGALQTIARGRAGLRSSSTTLNQCLDRARGLEGAAKEGAWKPRCRKPVWKLPKMKMCRPLSSPAGVISARRASETSCVVASVVEGQVEGGTRGHAVAVDLADERSLAAMRDAVVRRFGAVLNPFRG